ncbi:transposase [Nonomuraea sp. K274]|uniref:Transposase n=1 Tax=Nonomuraea cypriaca TaxID=1187855 RepID=A0A931AKC7_9ACTN|nr:transposase [Nonomuraea cypriaca]MBF8194171.1 transposase [Nonomuraea cypriaca]
MRGTAVHRCVELIASLTGVQPSPGFVHGMIARAAATVEAANLRIRALLTLAYAVCCDETPIRVGAKKAKKYLLVACTALYTWYMLGDRTMATFKKFVIADLSGVLVHDRYQNYDSPELGVHLTNSARATYCAILRTVRRPTPAQPGPPRSRPRCAG